MPAEQKQNLGYQFLEDLPEPEVIQPKEKPQKAQMQIGSGFLDVVGPDGKVGKMSRSQLEEFSSVGYREMTSEEFRKHKEKEFYEQPAAQFANAAIRFASGVSGGMSDRAIVGFGAMTPAQVQKLKDHNPWSSVTAEIGGSVVQSVLLGGAVSAAGKALAASKMGQAAKATNVVQKAIKGIDASTKAQKAIAAGKIGGMAALEGAVGAAGMLNSEDALEQREMTLSALGHDMLFGAGVGVLTAGGLAVGGRAAKLAGRGVKKGVTKTARKLDEMIGGFLNTADDLGEEAGSQVLPKTASGEGREISFIGKMDDDFIEQTRTAGQITKEELDDFIAEKITQQAEDEIITPSGKPTILSAGARRLKKATDTYAKVVSKLGGSETKKATKEILENSDFRRNYFADAAERNDIAEEVAGSLQNLVDDVQGQVKKLNEIIKPRAVDKSLREIPLEAASERAGMTLTKMKSILNEMKDNPVRFKGENYIDEMADILEEAEKRFASSENTGDLFRALDDIKKTMDANLKPLNTANKVDPKYFQTSRKLKDIRSALKNHLEDSAAYGDMAPIQIKLNDAQAALYDAESNMFSEFGKKLTIKGQKQFKIHSKKINTYLRQIGDISGKTRSEVFDAYTEAAENLMIANREVAEKLGMAGFANKELATVAAAKTARETAEESLYAISQLRSLNNGFDFLRLSDSNMIGGAINMLGKLSSPKVALDIGKKLDDFATRIETSVAAGADKTAKAVETIGGKLDEVAANTARGANATERVAGYTSSAAKSLKQAEFRGDVAMRARPEYTLEKTINASKMRRHKILSAAQRIIRNTEKNVNKAVDSFVETQAQIEIRRPAKPKTGTAGAAVRLVGLDDDDDDKKYRKTVRAIREMGKEKEALSELIDTQTSTFAAVAPSVSDGVHGLAHKKIEFLNSQIPKTPDSIATSLSRPRRVSRLEKYKLARAIEAVENPMSVVKKIGDGTVTRDQVRALKEVHPHIYNALTERLMNKLPELRSKLPYRKRLILSMLFDVPIESTTRPEFVQMIQGMYRKQQGGKQKKADGGQIKTTSKSLRGLKGAEGMGTNTERFLEK